MASERGISVRHFVVIAVEDVATVSVEEQLAGFWIGDRCRTFIGVNASTADRKGRSRAKIYTCVMTEIPNVVLRLRK